MRWHQLTLASALAAVASIVIGAPMALAGGWAITTLDEVPTVFRAGETYSIGYTIRQHGQTPLSTAQSAIEIRLPQDGAAERFAGKPDGSPGHYIAQVRFPETGEWEWSADQTPFARQSLGTVSVVPAAAATDLAAHVASPILGSAALENAAATAWVQLLDVVPGLRLGLPIISVLALVVVAWRVVLLFRALPASATHRQAAKVR